MQLISIVLKQIDLNNQSVHDYIHAYVADLNLLIHVDVQSHIWFIIFSFSKPKSLTLDDLIWFRSLNIVIKEVKARLPTIGDDKLYEILESRVDYFEAFLHRISSSASF